MLANSILTKFFHDSGIADPDEFVYRISQESDLAAVLKHGSSRKGISDMEWDRSLDYPEVYRKFGPLRHDEVIIASTFDDIWRDSFLPQGTLLHKLHIYKNPFITVYRKDLLTYLCEEVKNGPQNSGKNWAFKKDSRAALHMVCQINELNPDTGSFSLKFIGV